MLTGHQIRKLAIRNTHQQSDPRFEGNQPVTILLKTLILEAITDDYFVDFPVCPRIKKLDFVWTQLDETHELLPKLTNIGSGRLLFK